MQSWFSRDDMGYTPLPLMRLSPYMSKLKVKPIGHIEQSGKHAMSLLFDANFSIAEMAA